MKSLNKISKMWMTISQNMMGLIRQSMVTNGNSSESTPLVQFNIVTMNSSCDNVSMQSYMGSNTNVSVRIRTQRVCWLIQEEETYKCDNYDTSPLQVPIPT